MFIFDGTCPHCRSDKGFVAFGLSPYLIGEYDYSKTPLRDREILERNREKNPLILFSIAGNCHKCKKPVVAICETDLNTRDEIAKSIDDFTLGTSRTVRVLDIFPHPVQAYAHSSLPEKIREEFIDLQHMAEEKKRPYFIIMGCRAVLEAAVRHLGGEGGTLYQRVENLFTKGIITASLKDWASIIRNMGNDAAHEMGGTEEEARELVDFTKVFLQFTFELPATIADLKVGA